MHQKPHSTSKVAKSDKTIALDFFYVSKEIGDDGKLLLNMADQRTQMTWARVVSSKGLPEDGGVDNITRDAVKERKRGVTDQTAYNHNLL